MLMKTLVYYSILSIIEMVVSLQDHTSIILYFLTIFYVYKARSIMCVIIIHEYHHLTWSKCDFFKINSCFRDLDFYAFIYRTMSLWDPHKSNHKIQYLIMSSKFKHLIQVFEIDLSKARGQLLLTLLYL